MSERCVWITGAGGLIGNSLFISARQFLPKEKIVGLTRATLDLLAFQAVRSRFRNEKPDLLIHCAALSRSPQCQADPQLARKLNVEVTRLVAELATDIPFVFFSTDLVFDGQKGDYDESHAVNPLSVYAETKAEAETIVLRNERHLVVRTSLNCGRSPTGDRGLDEQLKAAWQAGQTLRLFTDEFRSPIPAKATAEAVWELVSGRRAGLYHIAGTERLSRWQIGSLLAPLSPDLNPRIEAASLKEYSGAPRSPDTSLNCAKAQAVLSFTLPRFSDWVAIQKSTRPAPGSFETAAREVRS